MTTCLLWPHNRGMYIEVRDEFKEHPIWFSSGADQDRMLLDSVCVLDNSWHRTPFAFGLRTYPSTCMASCLESMVDTNTP
jgi:hypothetical protein